MKFGTIKLSLATIIASIFIFTSGLQAQVILVSPDTLYMGQTPVSSKAVRQLYITNIDQSDLVISSLNLSNSNGYKLVNGAGPITIGFLQTFVLKVEFSPSSGGEFDTQLNIASNAKSGPTSILIQGKGIGGSVPTFERIFGLEDGTTISCVRQTSDGGYVMCGSATQPEEDYSDFYIAKTDSFGDIQWTKVYGRKYSDGLSKVLQTSDGGYIVIGNTNVNETTNVDVYIAKLDASGNVVWENTYGGQYDDKASSIVKTSDGYIIVGTTLSYNIGNSDIYVLKVDDSGNEIWHKNFGDSQGDNGSRIIQTKDGNYAIIGATAGFGAQGFDFYLMKIDGDGNELWHKLYGGSDWDEGNSIAELPNGDLVLAGFAVGFGPGGKDIFLIKTDADGNEIWHKAFGGVYQDNASKVLVTSDGIVVGGNTTIQIKGQGIVENVDIIVIKTDMDGNKIWQSEFGGTNDESLGSMILNSDGNIVLAGSTDSYSKSYSAYFLDINPGGQITSVDDNANQSTPESFKLFSNYPNPFNGQTQIIYQLPEQSSVDLAIYNITGQRVRTVIAGTQSAGQHRVGFNSEGLSSGVYFYRIETKFGIKIRKMVLLK